MNWKNIKDYIFCIKYHDQLCAADQELNHKGIQQKEPRHRKFVPIPVCEQHLKHFLPYGGKLYGGQHQIPIQKHYAAKPAHTLQALNQQQLQIVHWHIFFVFEFWLNIIIWNYSVTVIDNLL